MPNGVFPLPEFHSHPSRPVTERPGLALRMRARWRRNRLDDELARGMDPGLSPELSLRADQLRSRRERLRLGNALVEAVGEARGPNLGAFRVKTRERHAEIRKHAKDVLALAARLRDDQAIEARGVAVAARLVNRAGSLRRGSGQNLGDDLRAARSALESGHQDTQELASAA